jgi:superfamily II DNA/RNA helicase
VQLNHIGDSHILVATPGLIAKFTNAFAEQLNSEPSQVEAEASAETEVPLQEKKTTAKEADKKQHVYLDIRSCQHIVLDEADRLLNLQFYSDSRFFYPKHE